MTKTKEDKFDFWDRFMKNYLKLVKKQVTRENWENLKESLRKFLAQ